MFYLRVIGDRLEQWWSQLIERRLDSSDIRASHMGRAQPPSADTDPDTVWLLALIEAMDEVGASQSQACESSVIRAFGNRLDLPAMAAPPPNIDG